ncbi:unnamed protein product [Nesidiocoris tenuis]|uniref:Uncharacterized protein n=1 Tax=Nesidiocoris tenuis TaxID=355587 RepID=A0A6H5HG25_9HEMI|nr:unnamed protein product [Nesidiocoris tenuis]
MNTDLIVTFSKEHSKKIDVEKENKEYAESILDHLADLASTTLVDRQLFQVPIPDNVGYVILNRNLPQTL